MFSLFQNKESEGMTNIPTQCQTCMHRQEESCVLEPYAKLAGDYYEDFGGHVVMEPGEPCEYVNPKGTCEDFEGVEDDNG